MSVRRSRGSKRYSLFKSNKFTKRTSQISSRSRKKLKLTKEEEFSKRMEEVINSSIRSSEIKREGNELVFTMYLKDYMHNMGIFFDEELKDEESGNIRPADEIYADKFDEMIKDELEDLYGYDFIVVGQTGDGFEENYEIRATIDPLFLELDVGKHGTRFDEDKKRWV